MEKPVKKNKVAVLVDSANSYCSTRPYGIRLDLSKMKRYLTKFFGEITFAKIYIAKDEHVSPEKKRFMKIIEKAGFKVHEEGPSLETKNGVEVTRFDADEAIKQDMQEISDICDTIILFTGDGDFVDTTLQLIGNGKKVVIVSMRAHTSPKLIGICSHYIDLWDILNQVELKY